MDSLRDVSAIVICHLLFSYPVALPAAAGPPLGILTRAYEARLNFSQAFPGLSVFEGEQLSTTADGKLGLRVGAATLSLSQGASATLRKVEKGTHVDLVAGSLYFASPEHPMVEVHVADALLRPASDNLTQAEVRMLGPKVLQVFAMRGNLEFYYRDEFQVIPAGETYRIYLEAPAESQRPAGAGVPAVGISRRVVIYIMAGAMAAGGAAWGIHELLESTNGPENPDKP